MSFSARRRSLLCASIVTFTLGTFLGLAVAMKSPMPGEFYGKIRYHTRSYLGLQKNWVSTPSHEQVGEIPSRACPHPQSTIVMVIGGQSNAANVIPEAHRVSNDVSVWFDGKCYPGNDPILGATSKSGSIWSLLGDKLSEHYNKPVMLIAGSIGGTQFSDWVDLRSGYYQALINRVHSARDAGYEADIILWHQGETDAGAENDIGKIQKSAGYLLDMLLQDIPSASLYLFQATRCTGPKRVDGIPKIVSAIQDVAKSRDRVILGLNTDTLGRDYRWDMCHFNSFGRDRIVSEILPPLIIHLNKIFG